MHNTKHNITQEIEMKLIKNKEFLQQIAHQIDVLNTLGGGISLPQVKIDKQEKGAIIRVSIPAVSPEAYHIALDQNQLTIIAAHRFEEDSNSLIPLFSQQFTLPPQVDLSRIDAVYEVQELQVRLPYHTSVYKTRNIDITIKD
ncbi:hypothetical protein AHMF7616_04416 [Adhaeribacter pallidiroseus]|uniref:SHSP domain-containing protein n=2 Tax=Adhaeribacter pallidiroseus TaxID=2072847 RepID=A0A369QR56_9BACT|nr:hypothetical protein AHMF7616_04416 [Adhaeribacter pallidiroseus]